MIYVTNTTPDSMTALSCELLKIKRNDMNTGSSSDHPLKDQHGIAVTVETILVLDRFFISLHRQIVSGKGAGHDQQAGFRKMQIGNQRIGDGKIIRGVNENVSPSL